MSATVSRLDSPSVTRHPSELSPGLDDHRLAPATSSGFTSAVRLRAPHAPRRDGYPSTGNGFCGCALRQYPRRVRPLGKQHHEHCLGELVVRAWHEPDGERTQRGNRHEEIFVQRLAMRHSLCRLSQHIVASDEVRHEINQQQLPRGQAARLFDDDAYDEQCCQR